MSPDTTLLEVPATACETIASPPSLISVQFAPRLPFARLKSSEAVAARAVCGNTKSGTRRREKTTRSLRDQRNLDRGFRAAVLANCHREPYVRTASAGLPSPRYALCADGRRRHRPS